MLLLCNEIMTPKLTGIDVNMQSVSIYCVLYKEGEKKIMKKKRTCTKKNCTRFLHL